MILLILLLLVLVYLFLIHPGGKPKEAWAPFEGWNYAHRGLYENDTEAPENSLAAFRRAIEGGYGIEMDVQLTKDKIPVVFHDTFLDRVTRDAKGHAVHGKVCAYTLDQLRRMHLCSSEETIPTFQEFLELVDGRVPIIVEYKIEASDKTLEVCSIVDPMLQKYKGPYVVESFHPRGVLWYRKNRPDVVRGQLSDRFRKNEPPIHGAVYLGMEFLLMNFLTRPDFVAYRYAFRDNLSLRIVHDLYHLPCIAWTIHNRQEEAEAERFFKLLIFEHYKPQGH